MNIKELNKKIRWSKYYNITSKSTWLHISRYEKLSEDFIREFQDKVDWYEISVWQTLSENFIQEFQDKVNWKSISEYQKLSENFIKKFKNKVDWWNISLCQHLSNNFLIKFQDRVRWTAVSCKKDLSENFIWEARHKLDLEMIFKNCHDFSEEFIEKILKWLNSIHFSNRELVKKLSLVISQHQKISENLLRKYCEIFDLKLVALFQKFSKDFCIEFNLHKEYPFCIAKNINLSIQEKLDLGVLVKNEH